MGRDALIVDDDLDTRTGIAELLRGEGYLPHLAANGAEALLLLEGGLAPCLIVLDLRMPVMDGATFLDASRAVRPPNVGIIAVTALPNYLGIKARPEVRDVLPKPFDGEELLRLAREVCP